MSVRISSLHLIETGTYNDAYHRPLISNFNEQERDAFIQLTANHDRITPEIVGEVASQILRPQAQVNAHDLIAIPNGWGQRRFNFMMRVDLVNGLHATGAYMIITGYTDHQDVSFGQHLDPNMRLFINGITEINEVAVPMANGAYVTYPRVVNSNHVLIPPAIINNGYQTYGRTNGLDLQRPIDVVGALSAMSEVADPGTLVNDLRGTISPAINTIQLSTRNNNVPSDYLCRTVNCIRAAELATEGTTAHDFAETLGPYSRSRTSLRESYATSNQFLKWLNNDTMFGVERSITYGALCAHQPGLDNLVEVYTHGGAYQKSIVVERGNTEHWTVATRETEIATMLCSALPAMMSSLTLTSVQFRISNTTLDGQLRVVVTDGMSFAGENLDISPYLHRLEDRIFMELMPGITNNNMIAVDIAGTVDLYGDSHMTVSFNGGPAVPYGMPTFCDALYTPMLVTNIQSFHNLASDIAFMANNVGTGTSGSLNQLYGVSHDQARPRVTL